MRDQCEGSMPWTRLQGRQGPEKTHQGWGWQRASQSLMWESQAYGQWVCLMLLSSIAVLCLNSID